MSMLPRHGKCITCGHDWDRPDPEWASLKAGRDVIWDVPYGIEVRDIPQGVKVQTRPEGEPGTLWLHYKDGSQIPFSEAAAQTISDVMAAFETGQPQPCCGDFTNCKRMCIPRAEYWKECAEELEGRAERAEADNEYLLSK